MRTLAALAIAASLAFSAACAGPALPAEEDAPSATSAPDGGQDDAFDPIGLPCSVPGIPCGGGRTCLQSPVATTPVILRCR